MADLGDRRTYLGATDIAAIVGVSPFATPIDVYREKVEGVETAVSAEMEAGTILEPAIVEMYERQTGARTFVRNELVHHAHPFLRFHPDRLVYNESGVFDAKATWQRAGGEKWGEPGTDQVPPRIKVQMVLYCGASKRAWADVGLLRRPPLRTYRVPADPDLYDWLIAEGVRFWNEHILAEVPPPPDASESFRRYLRDKHPIAEELELVATPEQQLLVDELRASMAVRKAAEKHEDLLKNRLMDAMGSAAVLIAPGARITYRNTAASPRWKEIAGQIGKHHAIDLDPFVELDKAGRVGPRKFIPTFDEEEIEEAA